MAREEQASARVIPTGSKCDGPVILVAEDHAAVRQVFQIGLERAGYRVLLASHGLEALSVFRDHEPEIELVLVDFEMPYLRGDAVVRALRERKPDLLVVLCTSFAEWELSEEFDLGSVTCVLAKPCMLSDVVACVRDALQRRVK